MTTTRRELLACADSSKAWCPAASICAEIAHDPADPDLLQASKAMDRILRM